MEELGAFTTPTMPPTLALEAEMTVGTTPDFDGYDEISSPSKGSISSKTFEVSGVQYIVDYVGFEKGTNNQFALLLNPALPYDTFTLTLGATELSVGSTDYRTDTVDLVKNTGQTTNTTAGNLTDTFSRYGQSFTTGSNTAGYTLSSIGATFETIGDTSTAGSELMVTLNANNSGNPGTALCTLSDPASFSASGLHTFDAPATDSCPTLAASTTYFVVITRANRNTTTIDVTLTESTSEDSGSAAGWSIGDRAHEYTTAWSRFTVDLNLLIEVKGAAALPAPSVVVDTDGVGLYTWSGRTNPNWASGATVDVKLDIPLIDICGRSSAVADAIVAATLSYDFCHMTSQLDMDDITELDLTGRTGYGLKAGDFDGLPNLEVLNLSGYSLSGHNWNQLPVGLFDGLDNLEVLDLSDTNLLNLNRGIFEGLSNLIELDLSDTLLDSTAVPVGVFDGLDSLEILRIANAGYRGRGIKFVDEDIFRGLNTLRELDVGPIRPPDDVLAPLTSLQTLNGQDYTP